MYYFSVAWYRLIFPLMSRFPSVSLYVAWEREGGGGGHCNHLEQRCTVLNLLSV